MSGSDSRPRMRRARDNGLPRAGRSSAPPRSQARERLACAIATLSECERLILSLRLLERLTPAEAAHSLGISAQELNETYGSLLAALGRVQHTGSLLRGPRRSVNGTEFHARWRRAS